VQAFPGLTVAMGFSFRQEEPERGIAHFFALDAEGLPVDVAGGRKGPPDGYLATIPTPRELARLASANGVSLPPLLALAAR
jgi:hypothetical protein